MAYIYPAPGVANVELTLEIEVSGDTMLSLSLHYKTSLSTMPTMYSLGLNLIVAANLISLLQHQIVLI